MRLPSSLGWRVALAYTALIVGSIAAGSFYMVGFARETYLDQVHERVEHETQLVGWALAPRLVGDVDEKALREIVEAFAQAVNARVTVVAMDGRVLADSSEDVSLVGNLRERPEVARALAGGVGTARSEGETDQDAVIYTALPVTVDGVAVGAVRLAASESGVDRALRPILTAAGFAGVLAMALAVGLAAWLVRRTVRSVQSVSEGARRLAAGDLDHRVYAAGRDEAAELAATFNGMADRLRTTVSDLSTERNTLAALLETMSNGVVLVAADDRIVLANEAARELFDRDSHGLGEADSIEVLRDHDVRELLSTCREKAATQRADIDLPQARRHVRAVATPVSGTESGSVLVTFHDQTEQRRLDDTRREFVSNVSHELRTPIASIKAMAETLQGGALWDEKAAVGFVTRIHREADGMADLVGDLLALSRIETGEISQEPRLLDIQRLVDEVAARFQERAGAKGIEVAVTSAGAVRAIRGEQSLLRLVVGNLLDNAVRFTPEGGRIQVRTSESGGSVRIEVEDSGPGIEPEHLPHVFERFYKADRSRAEVGTGLGLSIARHVVEGHGGTIGVGSTIGSGTTFAFTLPTADPA